MNVEEFVRSRPCLDEIEGYREGRKLLGAPFTTDEAAVLFRWEKQLTSGKDVPGRSKMAGRRWTYRRGKPPQKVKAPRTPHRREDDVIE